MPFPTRNVFNVLTDESGRPLVGVTVKATLVVPYLSRLYRAEELPRVVKTQTDDTGKWVLPLVPNDVLDNPQSYYIVEEGEGEPIFHQHFIRVPSGTTDVWIGDVILPESPKCSPQLVAILHATVTSIRADGDTPLKGDIRLDEGTEITLVEDYANRAITIHGRLITGEKGIVVNPILPYERRISPVYGVSSEMKAIGEVTDAGVIDKFARIDHTHEGVHAINDMIGDVSLLPDVGISILNDEMNNQIFIANDPHQVVRGELFKVTKIYGGQYTQVGEGWFNHDLGMIGGWTVIRTDTNQDITDILTDNNNSTGVTISSTVSIKINLPHRMVVSQLRINANSGSFYAQAGILVDGTEYNTVSAYPSGISSELYQIHFFKEYALADFIYLHVQGYPPPEVFISEVRVYQGMPYWAPYLSGPHDFALCYFSGNVFLRQGFSYKLKVYWGLGDYYGDGSSSPPPPQITGKAYITFPSKDVLFLGDFGWKGALAPPYHNAIHVFETTVSPTVTGWATLLFVIKNVQYPPDYEHIYLLGVTLHPVW